VKVDFHKHALILAIIEKLRARGCRTGKTHVIKGLFLAGAAGEIEQLYDFFLYKHGPYSTDIESNLEQMTSYGGITAEPALDGYGVMLSPGEMAEFVKRRASLTPKIERAIDHVCRFIGPKNVVQLERLATAAWIRTRERIKDHDAVAARLHELKPHISLAEAQKADQDLLTFLGQE
jgi:uncharacterized protein YwgA